jgi:hypothetical protein
MRKFLIKVGDQQYRGEFPTSCDAVIDALVHFPWATRVSVRPCK